MAGILHLKIGQLNNCNCYCKYLNSVIHKFINLQIRIQTWEIASGNKVWFWQILHLLTFFRGLFYLLSSFSFQYTFIYDNKVAFAYSFLSTFPPLVLVRAKSFSFFFTFFTVRFSYFSLVCDLLQQKKNRQNMNPGRLSAEQGLTHATTALPLN